MDLLNLNIFRGGIFKQIKFLFSTPQQSQRCIYISEPGTISQEYLPMHTGFVSPMQDKKAWTVLHSLKFQVWKDGEPAQDDSVLVISDRSYIPLDPFNTMKPKDKERLASLKDIARLAHADVRSDMSKHEDTRTRLQYFIINGCFVMIGLFVLMALIKGCG